MLVVFYLVIIPVAGFLTKATFLYLVVYFKKMNGPILGKAHLEAFDRFRKTSYLGSKRFYFLILSFSYYYLLYESTCFLFFSTI